MEIILEHTLRIHVYLSTGRVKQLLSTVGSYVNFPTTSLLFLFCMGERRQ